MLLIILGTIFALSPLIRNLCSRLGIPLAVGYIVLGLAIGLFGHETPIAASGDSSVFQTLANLGVVALLFRVGLRSHTSALIDKLPDASLIWLGNVIGSFVVGYLVAHYGLSWTFETSLVVATAFSATSVAVSVSVWDELGKLASSEGQLLVDVAELDDLSAAILLAILVGLLPTLLNGQEGLFFLVTSSVLVIVFKLALFVGGCYLFAHFLERKFTSINGRLSDSPSSLTISILGAGLIIAAIADSLGFTLAIGALFAGLAFSRDPQAVRADGRFSYFYDLLTPFFFLHIGMQTDALALLQAADIGLILFIAAALAKLVFTILPALLSMNSSAALKLGVSMVPRAEIALVVLFACRAIDERLVSAEVFASMVFVVLATSIASPILLRRLLSHGRGETC